MPTFLMCTPSGSSDPRRRSTAENLLALHTHRDSLQPSHTTTYAGLTMARWCALTEAGVFSLLSFAAENSRQAVRTCCAMAAASAAAWSSCGCGVVCCAPCAPLDGFGGGCSIRWRY